MSRDEVLEHLRSLKGGCASGEELSRRLGLSRTAIWKAVDALRRMGYDIEAQAGKGYRLISAPDVLTEQEIRSVMRETRIVGDRLACFEEIGSTNTYAKKIGMEGAPDGTVIIADCQTAGRGRMGRSFQSPRGKGIYMTVLFRPQLPPWKLLPVTALAGVAVCRAVERVCGQAPGIKWPNDPVLNGKKLCGILTELSMEPDTGHLQYLAVGIGINVHHTPRDFSPEVAKIATSLFQETGSFVSRPQLAAVLIEELDRMYEDLTEGNLLPWLEDFRARCVNLGRTVRLIKDGTEVTAEAVGIDEEFGLVVTYTGGRTETVRSGEVSVRGLYGYAD